MKFVWSAVLALGIGGAAYADDDDEAKAPARTYTQAEVEALLDLATRVLKLEEFQQDAELEKLRAAAAKEKQDEQKGLPERVSALEKKMGSAGQTWDASKMLSFSTPDGNFTAKIGGRFYFIYRHIFDRSSQQGGSGNLPDTFLVDTARFQLDGTFYKDFVYRIEGEGKGGSGAGAFRLNDCWMAWQGLGDWVAIQAGIFKVPLSQEETTSSRFIDFAERSVINRITPGRETSIMLRGSLADKIFEWNVGFFNGATERESHKLIADTNDEKDGFLRFMATPMKNSDIGFLKQLRVGVDYARGKRDGPVGAFPAVAAPQAVSSGDLGFPNILTFTPGGALVMGLQSRVHYNFSWLYGPASLRAEYVRVRVPTKGQTGNPGFFESGAYIAATYLLTGEDKPLENRVKPKNNFDPLGGGWGAWELAARWAFIDASNGKSAGVVAPGDNHRTTQMTFGVNWWMTPNVRLMFDWEHFSFESPRTLGKFGSLKKTEDALYMRWQIDF